LNVSSSQHCGFAGIATSASVSRVIAADTYHFVIAVWAKKADFQFHHRMNFPCRKFRQVNAGINLFRKYDRERKASIQRTMKGLKEGKPLVTKHGGQRQKSGQKDEGGDVDKVSRLGNAMATKN
jgi:hypothetical protein